MAPDSCVSGRAFTSSRCCRRPASNHSARRVAVHALQPSKDTTVLVAGSTGGVGQLVVAKLVSRGFSVRALTRNKAKAAQLLSSDNVDIVEVDLRDKNALKKLDVYDGCAGAVMAVGTTAFPTGSNVHLTYVSSAGVERSGSFPFFILNTYGVLTFKRAAEEMIAAAGMPYTILRPSRLTDGPYTSYDINTLLQATSGTRQAVEMSLSDDLVGEASRIVLAEMAVQSLLIDELKGLRVAVSSVEGDGPGGDSAKWAALISKLKQ